MKRKLALLAIVGGFLTAASVQAVPITYTYTGNPFTVVSAPYTTSDFVSGMLTLAGPLVANMPLTNVTNQVNAFSFTDGVQTITLNNSAGYLFLFATGAGGQITQWEVFVGQENGNTIDTTHAGVTTDRGRYGASIGYNIGTPGTWSSDGAVADTGSTLSLMTLTLTALGVAARQSKRAAA